MRREDFLPMLEEAGVAFKNKSEKLFEFIDAEFEGAFVSHAPHVDLEISR